MILYANTNSDSDQKVHYWRAGRKKVHWAIRLIWVISPCLLESPEKDPKTIYVCGLKLSPFWFAFKFYVKCIFMCMSGLLFLVLHEESEYLEFVQNQKYQTVPLNLGMVLDLV
jgi:hypothetical protein